MAHVINGPRTAAELNAVHQQFWLKQTELTGRRIQDEAILSIAIHHVSLEAAMMVPLKHRTSFEQALAMGEIYKALVKRASSRSAGRQPKTDPLQRVIIEITSSRPDITTQALVHELRRLARSGHSVVLDVDQKSYLSCDQVASVRFDDNGKEKTAPISGLKDRLSRARKQIKSR